jgi:flagellin
MVKKELDMQINNSMDINNLLQLKLNQRKYEDIITKIATGQNINSAADDASGLMIADSLRNYAESLTQGMSNANDSIGMARIADGAMGVQSNILDEMKTKAVAANSAIHNSYTRGMIGQEMQALGASYESISNNTSFNGKSLLRGFDGDFQTGASANQAMNLSIGDTSLSKVTGTKYSTSDITGLSADGSDSVKMEFTRGGTTTTINVVQMGTAVGQGVGELAKEINKYSDDTGVKASYSNVVTGDNAIAGATLSGIKINGIDIGDIDVVANDSNGALTDAINAQTANTGIEASISEEGKLVLNSMDGRGIKTEGLGSAGVSDEHYSGQLTLTSTDGTPVEVKDANSTINFSSESVNLSDTLSNLNTQEDYAVAGDLLDSAITQLDTNRGNVGAFQNQMESQINNLSSGYVNTKYSESQIRDADIAEQLMNLMKQNNLTQADLINQQYINKYRAGIMSLLN